MRMHQRGAIKDLSSDVNLVASFCAHDDLSPTLLQTHDPVDCIVICASSVLSQASRLFATLQCRPELTRNLVLVGGIGHSTNHIYDSVARHPQYHALHSQIDGLPEAQVLRHILNRFFSVAGPEDGGPRVLVEDRSTNCGANAIETRKLLDQNGTTDIKTCIVVQDPTMSLRTVASFEKAYQHLPDEKQPRFLACPMFVPEVQMKDGKLEYVLDAALEQRGEDLWEMERLCGLLVGEIARLKDDENGYGPKGKGYIVHIDVPAEVEDAAKRAKEAFGVDR